ncbi:glycerophosphodiester phosphodiesterase [Alteromonas sp. 14N.309.X.WAT.G.H12]|uniref:glycerophosphodiester phosphodiesterase n=1 Tax=Alteromonas sp. 14N.309.X.WAT.G.H12 TaxID=3120824 RepID=UPI002FCFA081
MTAARYFVTFLIWQCLCLTSAGAVDIIAHRGASGYLPEHTLASTTLAFTQHPNYIEQDVVMSKDGVAVVLHDIHLETVTNVEAIYPHRAREDGRWYVLDFTFDELQKLTVHERTDEQGNTVFPHRYQGQHGTFRIATLASHIELIQQLNQAFDTHVGFYTEIKSPAWHREQGVDISAAVLVVLQHYGLTENNGNLYIQCFDFEEIKRLRETFHYKGKLIQLFAENAWGESSTDYDALLTESGIKNLAKYVDGVGPWLPQLMDTKSLKNGQLVVRPWVGYAKQAKLLIHPYTLRTDALPTKHSAETLLLWLTGPVGIDGLFTDQVPPVREFLSR